jgi:hypothetical protein
MKKSLSIFVIFILLATISISATSNISVEEKPSTAGIFTGEIGYLRSREWNKVGEISGTYGQRNRFYNFNGNWEITMGQYAGTKGTMKGAFGRNILLGRITFSESGRQAPIIGFIGFRPDTGEFGGRFMSVIGPALYFRGTYQ